MKHILVNSEFEIVAQEIRERIKNSGLKLVAEVFTSKILSGAGYETEEVTQIYFFRPDLMALLLKLESPQVYNAPLKIMVMQKARDVELLYPDPRLLFTLEGEGGSMVQELWEQLVKVIDS